VFAVAAANDKDELAAVAALLLLRRCCDARCQQARHASCKVCLCFQVLNNANGLFHTAERGCE
jgi:hypothetical protein